MSSLNFYCLSKRLPFESDSYEQKLTKTNKSYLLVKCPLCDKKHSKFIKKDALKSLEKPTPEVKLTHEVKSTPEEKPIEKIKKSRSKKDKLLP